MRKIEIAGIPLAVDNKQDFTEWVWSGHETEKDAMFTVSASEDEICEEVERLNHEFDSAGCEGNCLYRKVALKMLDYDGFLLHSAVVALDGEAYVFTAPGGTGKSTHANYWLREFAGKAYILNGDKPIIRKIDGKFYACGTPWRGKERLGVAENVPLKAVCLLERGTENSIVKATSDEMIDTLFNQVLLPDDAEQIVKQLDLLNQLVREVPIYRLRCNMSQEAAVVAYNGMNTIESEKSEETELNTDVHSEPQIEQTDAVNISVAQN